MRREGARQIVLAVSHAVFCGPAVERLDGVATASVSGGLEREIGVVLDPVRLEAYGIDPTTMAPLPLVIVPQPQYLHRRTDYFGNVAHVFMVQQPHTNLAISATCLVTVERPAIPVPADTAPWDRL